VNGHGNERENVLTLPEFNQYAHCYEDFLDDPLRVPLSYVETEIGPHMNVYTEYPSGQAVYTCEDTGAR